MSRGDSARASIRRSRARRATLSVMNSASWPEAPHTSTHSEQPLQCTGSTKMPNEAGARPWRLAGTSRVLLGVDEVRSRRSTPRRSGRPGARRTPAMRPSSSASGMTIARMAAVGAGADARHAADALLGDEAAGSAARGALKSRDRGRAGRDDAPRQPDVGAAARDRRRPCDRPARRCVRSPRRSAWTSNRRPAAARRASWASLGSPCPCPASRDLEVIGPSSRVLRRSRAPGRSSTGRRSGWSSGRRRPPAGGRASRSIFRAASSSVVRAVAGDGRRVHQVADREARPAHPEVFGGAGADRSVWERTPTSDPGGIDHGQPADGASSRSRAASVSGCIGPDHDRVARHGVATVTASSRRSAGYGARRPSRTPLQQPLLLGDGSVAAVAAGRTQRSPR